MNIDFSFITSHCLISPHDVEPLVLELQAEHLTNECMVASLLDQLKELYEADDYLLPASVVGMSLFNLIAAQTIVQSKYNQQMDMNLRNVRLQVKMFGNFPVLYVKINDCTLQPVSPINNVVQQLEKPISIIAKTAGVKPSLIYNQFGGRVAQITEAFLQHEKNENVKATYYSLLNQLKNDDDYEKNPFQYEPKFLDSPYNPGQKMMMRSSCCMFYRKKDSKKCYNCPTLSQQARMKMKEEILSATIRN